MKARSEPVSSAVEKQVSNELEEHIRCRAYGLYEQRGKTWGYELEDWLQAETDVLGGKAPSACSVTFTAVVTPSYGGSVWSVRRTWRPFKSR